MYRNEELEQRAGQVRLDAAPRMVQLRHQRHEQGYSMNAASNISSGDEVGFTTDLVEARQRAKTLQNDPSRWLGGVVMPIVIYNVADLRIVERYEGYSDDQIRDARDIAEEIEGGATRVGN